MSNIQPYQEKKHRGLGRLLGKRDKTPERERPDLQTDSAYGSSEANSADGPASARIEPARSEPARSDPARSDSDMVSAEKGSEIGDIDQNRNLALRPSTGEVFDEDTGEIVTVVTTTTTTTTTTTRKPGGRPQQDVQKDVRREVQPGPGPDRTGLQEMPAGTIGQGPGPQPQLQPAITSTSTTQGAPPPAPVSDRLSADLPPVPARSAMRKSQEIPRNVPGGLPGDDVPVSPVDATYPIGRTGMTPPGSPSRPNYSYPSRSSARTADQPMRHNQSTISDLRAAAKGLHGVGETLRGTLNSTIDSRFPSRDAEKAAKIEAHNAAVLEKGRAEMEGIPGGWPAHAHGAPGQEHGAPAHDITTGAPVTTSAIAPTTSANQPQRNISPSESGKPKGLGKLFKRKPVATGEQGMETR